MMVRVTLVVCLLGSLVGASGCSHLTARITQETVAETIAPRGANSSAVTKIGNADSIAFAPPEVCSGGDAIGYGEQESMLGVSCGTMMANLESAAIRAGWRVVSWRALLGGDDSESVLNRARASNVDILVHINELRATLIDAVVERNAEIFFEEISSDEEDTVPWRIRSDRIDPCVEDLREQLGDIEAEPVMGYGLDAQVVDVATGEPLYHHQSVRTSQETEASVERYEWPRITKNRRWRHFMPPIIGTLTLLPKYGAEKKRAEVCLAYDPHVYVPRGQEAEADDRDEPRVSSIRLVDSQVRGADDTVQFRRQQVDELVAEFIRSIGGGRR